jgi:hypothetical protein
MAELNQKFTITSEEDRTEFTATFADGSATVTDGYAGWEVVPRPKRVAVTEWRGRNPLDYYMTGIENPGIHCEDKVSKLEKLCGLGHGHQPPICRVDGQGAIPHDYTVRPGLHWVIEALAWDKAIELRTQATGRRLRCGGTITVRQFSTARDVLRTIKSTDRAIQPRKYIVKKGDTLNKIAKKFYKDPNKWKIIADANKLRDRRSIYVGQKLMIPRVPL